MLTTHDTNDIVQGVFVAMIELSETRLSEIEDPVAYLVIATRNACHNSNRAAARRANALATSTSLAQTLLLHRESSTLVDPERLHPLHAALSALDATLRELLLLKHIGGLTFDQMSLCLKEPRGTLASRYRLALDTLRASMDTTGEAAPNAAKDHQTPQRAEARP